MNKLSYYSNYSVMLFLLVVSASLNHPSSYFTTIYQAQSLLPCLISARETSQQHKESLSWSWEELNFDSQATRRVDMVEPVAPLKSHPANIQWATWSVLLRNCMEHIEA